MEEEELIILKNKPWIVCFYAKHQVKKMIFKNEHEAKEKYENVNKRNDKILYHDGEII